MTKFKNKYSVEFIIPAKRIGLVGVNIFDCLKKEKLLKNKNDKIHAIGIKLTPKTVCEFCSKETMQTSIDSDLMLHGENKEFMTLFVVSENNVILPKDKEVVINHLTGAVVEDKTNVNGHKQKLFKVRVTLTHSS